MLFEIMNTLPAAEHFCDVQTPCEFLVFVAFCVED